MKRTTTIYLSEDQKQDLEEIAARTRRTESDLIREGVDQVIDAHGSRRRKPQPLFALNDPVLDYPGRVEEALEGFGESGGGGAVPTLSVEIRLDPHGGGDIHSW